MKPSLSSHRDSDARAVLSVPGTRAVTRTARPAPSGRVGDSVLNNEL